MAVLNADISTQSWKRDIFSMISGDLVPNSKYKLQKEDKLMARRLGFKAECLQNIETRRRIKCLLKAAVFVNALLLAGMNTAVTNILSWLSWDLAACLCIACPHENAFNLLKRNRVLLQTICVRNTRFAENLFSSHSFYKCKINLDHLINNIALPTEFHAEFLSIAKSGADWKFETIKMIPNVKKLISGFHCSFNPDRILFNPVFDIITIQYSPKHVEFYRYFFVKKDFLKQFKNILSYL
jgi:hypothetical protein